MIAQADIYEVFCSVQGEGLYAGQKQVFVRFAGCDLDCDYCDEPAAKGGGRLMRLDEIKKRVKNISSRNCARAVSFTGGEPLLQASALKDLALYARRLGMKTHLETNGINWRELRKVISAFDVIAADIKLPGSSGRAFWAEHAKFLAVAPEKTFVKIIVTSKVSRSEFIKAVKVSANAGAGMPFFIQPVTPKNGLKPPSREQIAVFHRLAASKLDDVRILPQLHPLWGIK